MILFSITLLLVPRLFLHNHYTLSFFIFSSPHFLLSISFFPLPLHIFHPLPVHYFLFVCFSAAWSLPSSLLLSCFPSLSFYLPPDYHSLSVRLSFHNFIPIPLYQSPSIQILFTPLHVITATLYSSSPTVWRQPMLWMMADHLLSPKSYVFRDYKR